MSFTPDPKDGLRVKASSAEWLAIRAEKVDEHVCRVCCAARATEAAHLVPRSRKQEGDDVADNIVGLCLHCHDLVDAYDRAACSALRRALSRQELAYVVGRKGRGWLDQRFPWDASLPEGDSSASSDQGPSLVDGSGGHGSVSSGFHQPLPASAGAPSESDETCPRCKGKGKVHKRPVTAVESVAVPPRVRKTWSVSVPADARENGADALDTLIDIATDHLREAMGWETPGKYVVLCAVLTDWVNTNVPVNEAAA